MSPGAPVRILLVGGHESADGAELARFSDALDTAAATAPGRGFHDLVSRALDDGQRVVVVPMTFGRNPTMVADTAKTLRWLAAKYPGRVALAAPFGQIDHLTAWLRTAANRARATDAATALLIVAPRSNPFDEAELHRIAYLVATHGALSDVFATIADDALGIGATADRARRLGAERVVAVPAGFAAALPLPDGVESAGVLMSDAAVGRVLRTRVRDALADLAAGHDGIAAGLDADHGHGYAHSHTFEESQGESHGHSHAHGHSHPHGHSHAHGHSHPHSDGDSHAHVHADGTHHAHDHDGPHAHFADDTASDAGPRTEHIHQH